MSNGTLHITDSRSGKNYKIPIRRNAILATDLKKITVDSTKASPSEKVGNGLRVHDPGLENTTVVESSISFADGDRGLLLLRGYALEQLWQSEFEDMLHLMVWGQYPTPSQSAKLGDTLFQMTADIPPAVFEVIKAFPRDCPPMPMLTAGLAAYMANDLDSIPAYKGGNIYHGNMEATDRAILKTAAAYAVVMGIAASHRRGIPFMPPSPERNYFENLFAMMGLVDPRTNRPDPLKVACYRKFAALNSDHGMALSVFANLVTTSSLADPISGLISSLAAAYGPLHFGAPEAAYKTISTVNGLAAVPAFLDEVKSGKRRLFGFGHRTYKTVDPRLAPIKEMLIELQTDTDPLLQIAKEIERLTALDEYFLQRKLHANADFYGVFFFIALGFQPEEIPVAMLAQRLVGILAHWRESMFRKVKLFRPTHIYTGNPDPVKDMDISSKL